MKMCKIALALLHLAGAGYGRRLEPPGRPHSLAEVNRSSVGGDVRGTGTSNEVELLARFMLALCPSTAFTPCVGAELPCQPVKLRPRKFSAGCRQARLQVPMWRDVATSGRRSLHNRPRSMSETLVDTYDEIRREAADLWQFLCKPAPGPRLPGRHAGPTRVSDFCSSLHLWRRVLFWSFALCVLNTVYLKFFMLVSGVEPDIVKRANKISELDRIPFWHAVVIGPINEELTFRYHLRQLPPVWIIPLVILISQTVMSLLLYLPFLQVEALGILPMSPEVCWQIFWSRLKTLSSMSWVFWILTRDRDGKETDFAKKWRARVRTIFRKRYGAIVYISSILFGLVHISNFHMSRVGAPGELPLWMLPFLTVPQVLAGFVLSWLRIRCGIGYAILAHGCSNLFATVSHDY